MNWFKSLLCIGFAAALVQGNDEPEESELAFKNAARLCRDSKGNPGYCKAECLCGNESAERGTCRKKKVCCVESCKSGRGDPCLDDNGDAGKCKHSGKCRRADSTQGSCSSDYICCVKHIKKVKDNGLCEDKNGKLGRCKVLRQCYNKKADYGPCHDSNKVCCVDEGSTDGEDPYIHGNPVSKACESAGGDGICSAKCGFGTFNGGHSDYCDKSQQCCVIDYRPAVGRQCLTRNHRNDRDEHGTCTRSQYCEDSHKRNNICFEGVHCCDNLPDIGEKCDCGYGTEGQCIPVDSHCNHEKISTCSKGLKCCSSS